MRNWAKVRASAMRLAKAVKAILAPLRRQTALLPAPVPVRVARVSDHLPTCERRR